MKLQSVQNSFVNNNSYSDKKPVFREWKRDVYRKTQDLYGQELKHRNNTLFFRDGWYWSNLVDFLVNKYKNVEKVNVYNYGCSDGSEPYTFIMSLITKLGEQNIQKFFPILARDYDAVAIEKAKSNKYQLNEYEVSKILEFTSYKFGEFFDTDKTCKNGRCLNVSPKKVLTSKVDFKVASILNDYKRIKPENSVVFARNFWPYLKEDVVKLVNRLSSQMKENSTLVIGKFDLEGCDWNNIDLEMLLIRNGFKSSNVDLVFQK